MTLDEAIIHCEELADGHDRIKQIKAVTLEECKCAYEHRQLAEWLRELKAYKEQTDGDLISRQAVKNLIRSLTKWSVRSQDRKFENVGLLYDDVMFGIDRLPSAEKTTLSAEKTTITDTDLITRESVITMLNKIENAVEDGDGFQFNEWVEYAKDIPSAEKMAEWIKQKSGDELFPEEIVCSKCYHSNSHLDFDEHNNPIGKVFLESKYCPNCGAKMEESE